MTKELTNSQLLLKECIRQEFSDSSIYTEESTFFEFFAASQVLKNQNLSDDELDEGIVGSSHDGGCDGLYVFLNGDMLTSDQLDTLNASKGSPLNFTIIQAKNTTSFNETTIMKWKTISENLLNMANDIDSFCGRYNEDVCEKFRLFRDALTKLIRSQIKTHIQFYYVTLAVELHPNVEQQAEELKEQVKRLYPATTVSVSFVGADKLMELYNTDSEANVNLELASQPIALGLKADYVALVNLGTYFKFVTDDVGNLRKSFFEANVRDYQGRNVVNKCIFETLSSSTGEDFWWLNNGVTVLAEKITPEIVNGLQTSTEIYNYFSINPELLGSENRNLLVRIIVPDSEESRDNIIFATNNQTNIPKSSLRVTDTIHLQIEMYFKSRGLYYDRRKNYYKNQRKKADDIVGVSFLAQCLISVILRKPDFARARPSTLLTDDSTYAFLYEDNQDLDVYYKVALLGKKIQRNLRATTEMTPAERSDVLFYLLYAVVAKVLNKKEITFSDLKKLDLLLVTDVIINETKLDIYEKYKELGGNGRVAKSSTFINEIDKILGF